MDVDKVKFIADVKRLKADGIIVFDNEIITMTGVAKSSLSAYLNPENKLLPSKPFLKKFYDAYGEALDVMKVAEPIEEYVKANAEKIKAQESAALDKLTHKELKSMYLRQLGITEALQEQIKIYRSLLDRTTK